MYTRSYFFREKRSLILIVYPFKVPRIFRKLFLGEIDSQDPSESYVGYSAYQKVQNIDNYALNDNDLSIDHVIPWSYLFSDDLWNLVYVKKSENSSKSNRIPPEEMIIKLEQSRETRTIL